MIILQPRLQIERDAAQVKGNQDPTTATLLLLSRFYCFYSTTGVNTSCNFFKSGLAILYKVCECEAYLQLSFREVKDEVIPHLKLSEDTPT